jgi:hypothetical protein
MTSESEERFVEDIDADPVDIINKMLATIDCENSRCFKEEDKTKIHTAICQKVGFWK